jgi:hypothetical protein
MPVRRICAEPGCRGSQPRDFKTYPAPRGRNPSAGENSPNRGDGIRDRGRDMTSRAQPRVGRVPNDRYTAASDIHPSSDIHP